MSFSIIWSPDAVQTYRNTLDYLEEKWTINEVSDFVNRIQEVLSYISKNPLLYPNSPKGNSRKCVLTKQVNLYYEIQGSSVILLYFWDNRQNPEKINKRLK